jgi:bacterioferritin
MSNREEKKARVIEVLNKARSMELQAIHQYMNQHYNLDDRDLGELAKNIKLIAIDEMTHAEAFAERIKELGGEPTSELSAPVIKGQETVEIFTADAKAEEDTMEAYNEFAKVCSENGDSITKKLFEQIINDEQEHLNYFDNIAGHIENLGNVYLARIAGTSASTGGTTKSFVNQGE